MLQIITEKFYRRGERYETLHRAVYYTNYKVLMRAEPLETPVGVLLPTTGLEGLAALTCEILEKIEKDLGGKEPGGLISTGGTQLINDFAAVTAFCLNITCTPDPDLARRLLSTDRPSLGVQAVPSLFIKRTFDRQVISQEGDRTTLADFTTQLVGLERKRFETAMRSIRYYVTGLHRIADNFSLAYTQLVMSLEALAQAFDGYVAEWSDYEYSKRVRIEAALEGATADIGTKVREAVLENEHVAAARRFRDFSLSHIEPSFFRDEAMQIANPINRSDLRIALRQAYAIRSQFVHTLQEIPRQLTIHGMPETIHIDGQPALSIAGLARLARHVIMQFIARGPVVASESFDYRRALPNIVTLPLASQYWIANTGGFNFRHGPEKLSAQIEQITSTVLLQTPETHLTDIRPVLSLIEEMVPSLQDREQRLPLLTMYFLFHELTGPEFACAQWPKLFLKYKSDFDHPSIESFVAHILTGQGMEWSLEQFESLQRDYLDTRHHKGKTKIGRLLEAALFLHVAELSRRSENEERARELVALAVDMHPNHAGLRNFENSLSSDLLPEIKWEAILLPTPTQAISQTEDKPHGE